MVPVFFSKDNRAGYACKRFGRGQRGGAELMRIAYRYAMQSIMDSLVVHDVQLLAESSLSLCYSLLNSCFPIRVGDIAIQ